MPVCQRCQIDAPATVSGCCALCAIQLDATGDWPPPPARRAEGSSLIDDLYLGPERPKRKGKLSIWEV